MKKQFLLPALFLLAASWNLCFSQIYVHHAATGANDGTSWTDAYTDLKTAISTAPEAAQLWVAAGTYRAGDEGSNPIFTYFYVGKKIFLYGGFAGTETSLDERDIAANETKLNGDLSGDDLPGDFETNRGDNGIHVLLLASTAGGTIVDGFTVEHGSAKIGTVPSGADGSQWRGGGILVYPACYIRNCTFRENRAGWGMACATSGGSFVHIENCLFMGNNGERGSLSMVGHQDGRVIDCDFIDNFASEWGGAMNLGNSNCLLRGCNFTDNVAVNALGGAIFMWQNSGTAFANPTVTFEDCNFSGNSGPTGGALAMNNFFVGSRVVIDGCVFENNVAPANNYGSYGGGMSLNNYNSGFGSPPSLDVRMYRTRFEGNSAEHSGGAEVFSNINQISVEVDSCEFIGNHATNEGGGFSIISYAGSVSAELSNLTFVGNSSVLDGGGLLVANYDLQGTQEFTLTDSWFEKNTTAGFGGGLYVESGAATVGNCTFLNNQAEGGGGGAHLAKCEAHLLDSHFGGNRTEALVYGGGGLSLFDGGPSTVERSTFQTNSSEEHGASLYRKGGTGLLLLDNVAIWGNDGLSSIWNDEDLSLRGVTLHGNTMGLFHSNGAELTLQNCILADDGPNYQFAGPAVVTTLGSNLSDDASMAPVLMGVAGYPDLNSTDPMLDANLVPLPGSPCIDAGNPDGIDAAATDAAGHPRIIGTGIDIGAFESGFVSAAREALAGQVGLWPNPTNGPLNLELPADANPTDLFIFDSQGRLVLSQTFAAGQTLSVAHLPSGMYSLKLTDGERVYVGKFVKK